MREVYYTCLGGSTICSLTHNFHTETTFSPLKHVNYNYYILSYACFVDKCARQKGRLKRKSYKNIQWRLDKWQKSILHHQRGSQWKSKYCVIIVLRELPEVIVTHIFLGFQMCHQNLNYLLCDYLPTTNSLLLSHSLSCP